MEESNLDDEFNEENKTIDSTENSNPVTPKRKRQPTNDTDVLSPGGYQSDIDIEEEQEDDEDEVEEEEDDSEEESDEDYVDDRETKQPRKKIKIDSDSGAGGSENEEDEQDEESEEEVESEEEEEIQEESEEEFDSDVDSVDLELNDESDPNYKKPVIETTSNGITTTITTTDENNIQSDVQMTDQQKTEQQQQQVEQQPQQKEYDFNTGLPEDDYLVPIKLEILSGYFKLSDSLLWNINEKSLTPQQYVHRLCVELDYPEYFEQNVIDSMTQQINHHKSVMREFAKLLPLFDNQKEFIISIQLDLNVNGLYLKDKFQWDIFGSNSPEIFARTLSQDLGLSREFESTIVFSIHEQLQHHIQQIVNHPQPIKYITRQPLKPEQAFRPDYDLPLYSPTVSHNKHQQATGIPLYR
ncbi:CHE group protein [Tieghemostelium lacteum]|uniref:CHE group protein n=1 Tax=Tieghemostelium lacteum TaxID=361077 RepID=A0A151Z2N3_TIELA|nr:CHE group protein [Tieghemostelium lacteum]|eukprot:KYQ88209.1 CHE group protein [Tieghemostelium lacteum]